MYLVSTPGKCLPDHLMKSRLSNMTLVVNLGKWAQCFIRTYNFQCCPCTRVKSTSPVSKET